MGAAEETEGTRKPRLAVRIPRPCLSSSTSEEDGEPLSPAARLFRQPQLNCHIIAFFGFAKVVGEEIKAGLEATLLRHPRFSSVQVTGKAGLRWVRTKVNLDDHVVYPDLGGGGGGDSTEGDRLVEDYAASLCRSPLDPSRPLWDLHILAVRTSEAACVAIFRIHHSLGDGISLMSLFLACTRRTSDPLSLPSIPEARRRPAVAAAGTGLRVLLLWLWTIIVYAWNTLVDMFIFVASTAILKDTKTAIKGTHGVENRPKRFVHRTLCLDDLKAIKNDMGCVIFSYSFLYLNSNSLLSVCKLTVRGNAPQTINDVLVGVMSAALSRYLSRTSGSILPKNLRIRSTLLVNIRPTTGIQELAEMMKEGSGAKWGNQLGYILLPFPVMKCDNPLEYVRKGTAVAERKKKSLEAMFTYASALLIVKTLGIKAAALLCYKIVSNTSFSFSNLVGPTEEVGFCGSPLVYIAPTVYGHPQALTVHFQSYMNKMKVVVAVDELVIPDPHKLLDDIADSLRLIKDAAAAGS
ncbi:O-acyltransferase WSD1 [Apostasia shenzhenica]|uniref:O-acyltransferase WSD1 n=1 Tax=Apostasia shenzhenica TaxID=1088818 RepID=A0A2I0B083_9ASPA|nr:O-acyltransferase WSD1 [Apostasia shenzhenica]